MSLIKLNNNGVKNITSVGNIGTGDLVFISKQTASSSASISFTSGIDSTYKEYVFYFVNIHPSTASFFEFNMSTDGGSNYNVVKTSTIFVSAHIETDTDTTLTYRTAQDLAQSTDYQKFSSYGNTGAENDECISGSINLYNPSSTTFVKHFMATTNTYDATDYSINSFIAGYGNTTSAVNAINFRMSSGNIDSGDILLYGVN